MQQNRKILLVTQFLPPQIQQRAETLFEIRIPEQHRLRDWLATQTEGDALLCIPGFRFDASVIQSLPSSIKVIGTYSVGFDHIDVAAAHARGIAVVHTPGVLNQATAEFTMALALAAARRIGEGERIVRANAWDGFKVAGFLGTEISGKRMGIFGMGRIGQTLARIAHHGFGMEIHYHNRRQLAPAEADGAIYHADEASFLAASEVLCILAPASPETHHWLNAARLAALPQGAIVINTARGSLVDDDALAAALASGHIAAAGLDVFPREPQVPNVYLGLQNVVLTPHIASATSKTRLAMGNLVLDGIAAVLAGASPPNLVK